MKFDEHIFLLMGGTKETCQLVMMGSLWFGKHPKNIEVMGLPAMQAQRPEPTGETIGRAIEPWMKVVFFVVLDTLGCFF